MFGVYGSICWPEPHLTFVEGTVTQMDEDMGDSPETGRSKVDIKCLSRMQISVILPPLLESPH